MTTMVDRVARAIFAADYPDEAGSESGEVLWEKRATWYRAAARAAIEAMREPTETVIAAKQSVDFKNYADPDDEGEWRAIIDALLAEYPN